MRNCYVSQSVLYNLHSWEWHLGPRQSCPTSFWRRLIVVEYDVLSCATGFINPPLSICLVPIYVGFILAFKPRPLAIGQLLSHHLRRPAHFDACAVKPCWNCRWVARAEDSIDDSFSATPDTDRFARCEGHGGRRAEEDRGAKSGGWEDKPSLSHHFCHALMLSALWREVARWESYDLEYASIFCPRMNKNSICCLHC